MKMKVACYEQPGPANKVLHIRQMNIPEIGPHEVLIRLYTSGINPSDVKKRQGLRENMPFPCIIPHSDGAGIIERVGSNISQKRVGQRVWTYNARWQRPFGTAAEFVVLPESLTVPLPNHISFAVGACLGIPAMTAHRCVFSSGTVENKTVLITGGAGNVGYYAIQFAKWGGATVIATVSNSKKALYAKNAGADYILNYREENIIEKIQAITYDRGVDLIVEVDFGGNLSINQTIISLNGHIAAYASEGNPNPQLPFYPLLFRGVTLHLINVYELPAQARTQAIRDINLALDSQFLTSMIAAQFPLENIITAHHLVESGSAIGNVILTIK